MATLTGTNLLDSIIDSTGIEPNALIYATLSAKLQQMIDNGTYSKLAASLAISGFSTQINAATEALDLADTIEANVALIQAAADEAAVDAIDFPDYGGAAPITYTLTSSADAINEGETNTFTVTASQAVATDTDVTFQLKVDGTGDTAQAADFNAGSFNAQTVTIAAGSTTATFDMSTVTADGTEVTELYSVDATVAGQTLTKQVSILDGALGAGQTFVLTKNLDIIPGMEGSNGNTVTSGDDTVIGVIEIANTSAAAVATANSTLNATDLLNTGLGTDTARVVLAGAVTGTSTDYTVPTNIEGVETFQLESSATFVDAGEGVIADVSGISGLTTVNVLKSADVLKLTAAGTTDVNVTMKASGEDTDIEGGKDITVAVTDVAAAGNTIDIGGTTQATGAVSVTATGKASAANTDITMGIIDVKGGTTISVTQVATSDNAKAASDTNGATHIQGAVNVTGDASTTAVTVKQDMTVGETLATNKAGGSTETASVKFSDVTAGQTLILGGLTFTAAKDMTAAQAAAAFANLSVNTLPVAGDSQGSGLASLGTYTGNFTGWTSGAVSTDTVVFTSTTANAPIAPDLANTGTATAVVTVTTDGKAHSTGATGGILGVTAGAVSVTDANATIKTITVDGYGASSTTTTSVLETLNLANSSATMTVADTAATLALNLSGLGSKVANVVTHAGLDFTAAPTTLNVTSTGNNYVDLTAAATKTLTVAGTGTLSADNVDGFTSLETVTVTGSAGLELHSGSADTITSVVTTGTTGTVRTTIEGARATYTGGAGVDNVTLATDAAVVKAIDLGAGNDMLTFGASVTGSTKTMSGGDGTDTLAMSTANAAALDAGAQSFYTNFEQLYINDAGATSDIDLANLGFANYVMTNGSAGTLTLSNMANNGTVALTAAPTTGTTVKVKDATLVANTSDVLNIHTMVSTADIDFKTVTAAGVETININADDTVLDDNYDGKIDSTNDVVEVATMTLAADKATKVAIEGDSHLTLSLTGNEKIAEVNGSSMTGNLTVTAAGTTAATITGGSGNDVLTASVATGGGTGETQTFTITAAGTDTAASTITITTPGKAAVTTNLVGEQQTITLTGAPDTDANFTIAGVSELVDIVEEQQTFQITGGETGGVAGGNVVVGGVSTGYIASASAQDISNAVVGNKAAIIAANTTIADITNAGGTSDTITIVYKTSAADVAALATSVTGTATITGATTTDDVVTYDGVTIDELGVLLAANDYSGTNIDGVAYDAGTDTLTLTYDVSAGPVAQATVDATTTGATFTQADNVVLANAGSVDAIGAAIAATDYSANTDISSVSYDAGTDTVSVLYTAAAGDKAALTTGGTSSATLGAVTDDAVVADPSGSTADTLIGGLGDDTLIANDKLTTLTGGEGNDMFVIGTASLNSSSYSTITDFAAGDLIKMTGADSFAASAVTQGDTAVFQDYANAAMNSIGQNDVAWFQYANNTYIVMDAGVDSTTFTNAEDFVVRLTGLVDLTDATFNDTYDTIALA
jgi:S-layer protein